MPKTALHCPQVPLHFASRIPVLFAIPLFVFPESAQVVSACLSSCGLCNPSYFGYDSQCTYTKCITSSCVGGYAGCSLYYDVDGTSCLYSLTSGGVCSSGKCVQCISNTDCSGGKTCQSNVCACPSGTTWDSVSGSCKPSAICTATLSVSTSPSTAPCTVSASVNATGCDGQTFAIKDSAGTTKCSGVITAGSGMCSSWSISSSTSYSLYLSGSATPSDTKTASCGCSSCPDGTAVGSCNSAGQKCNLVSGSCVLQGDLSCSN